MQIETKIQFEEEYLPTKRHRIPRIRKVEEAVTVDLREIHKEDAPVAMVVTDHKSYLAENGQEQFGLRDISYVAFENALYVEKRNMSGALDEGPYFINKLAKDIARAGDCYFSCHGKTREDMLRSLKEFTDSHVLIDGVIYEQKNEPRYVVQTFGLGHNHGGTALMISNRYNPNISKDCYFSALEREKAIAYADKVAAARGDTNYVGTFGKGIGIKVYMPEMVQCKPQQEHGEGNPFLNSLNEVIAGSDSLMESGLLCMAMAPTLVSETKPSLEEQIQSASNRAAEPQVSSEEKNKDIQR